MDAELTWLLAFGAGLGLGLALQAELRLLQRWRRWQYDPVTECDEVQTAIQCLALARAPNCIEVRRLLLAAGRQRLDQVHDLVARIRRSMEACEESFDEHAQL